MFIILIAIGIFLLILIIGGIIVDQKNRKQLSEEQKSQNPSAIKSVLIIIGIFLLCAIIIIGLFLLFFKTNITEKDISLKYNNANLSTQRIECTITANTEVENVELEFVFYNYNNEKHYSMIKTVFHLDKNESTTIFIKLTEIKSNFIPITCEVKVVAGKKKLVSFGQKIYT